MKVPDVKWIVWNRLLMPRHRAEWLKGSVEKDGFKWQVRGVKDSYLAWREHEEWLMGMMSQQRGSLFVDIGAHVGRWTLRASRSHRKVVAFEPHPANYRVLWKNLVVNRIMNVNAFNVALSDSEGLAPLREYGRGTGASSLLFEHPKDWWSGNPFAWGRESGTINVPTRKLDDYGLVPSFVKIDTEGWEIPVLEGALVTLQKYHPRVLVEIHLESDLERVPKLLRAFGYPHVETLKHPVEIHVLAEK